MLARGIFALALFSISAFTTPLYSQQDQQKTPTPTPTAEQLVQQLSAEGYSVRQRAEGALKKMGVAAKAALIAGMENEDLEVRLTCHKLLIAALQQDFQARLDRFSETGEASEQGLPGWKAVSAAIGTDENARAFYVSMCKADLEMLSAIENGGDDLSVAFSNRAAALYNQRSTGNYVTDKETAVPILTACLIAGQQAAVKDDQTSQRHLYSYLGSNRHVQQLLDGKHRDISRRVLEDWVEGSADGYLGYTALNICLQYELKDVGLRISRKALQENTPNNNSVVPYAAITVGRFGDKSDIPSLLPLLENKNVCHSWHNGQFKDVIRIQVRDVTLAVLLHMTDQDPANYGFDLLQQNEDTLFHIYTAGFVEDDKREDAQEKWRTWSKENLDQDPIDGNAMAESENKPVDDSNAKGE